VFGRRHGGPMKTRVLVAIAGLVVAACRGGAPESSTSDVAARKAPAKAAVDGNACHLLTHEEVSEIAGRKVTMADQSEAGDNFSTCDWEDEAGVFAFGVTVYWSGGKEQWETWRLAQGLGDTALKSGEGVGGSDAVKQGLVPGIGDAAYFSPVLPSLVLKGDTLFEIKFSLAPQADARFAGLAARLLERAK
jgi:hypothetical protein